MLPYKDFDELNEAVGLNRSEDYEEYFDVMDLPDEDKKKRVTLAEKLGDNFLLVLAFLFTVQQYQQIDWTVIQLRFEYAYRDALSGTIKTDEYLDDYIKWFSYDVTDSTREHVDDPYYYSADRSRLMAENESASTWSYDDYSQALQSGMKRKQWKTQRDKRVRESHAQADGKIIGIDELFFVGNSLFRFPRDDMYSPDAADRVNCRCVAKYLK